VATDDLPVRLSETFAGLDAALTAHCGDLPSQLTVARFMQRLGERSRYDHYEDLPVRAQRMIVSVQQCYSPGARAAYLKAALCTLMQRTLAESFETMPAGIQEAWFTHFNRILDDFSTHADDYYALEQPRKPLEKDLALCGGWAIPIGGAWLVEQRILGLPGEQPVPRSTGGETWPPSSRRMDALNRWSGRALQSYLARVRLRWGLSSAEVRHCYVVHTVERQLRHFSAQKHRLAYLNLADLADMHDQIEGVYRCSWFLDPALTSISPNLEFLQALPRQGGARFWPVGPPWERAFHDAIEKSPARKQAYAQGVYNPWLWSFYWSQEDLAAWAASNR